MAIARVIAKGSEKKLGAMLPKLRKMAGGEQIARPGADTYTLRLFNTNNSRAMPSNGILTLKEVAISPSEHGKMLERMPRHLPRLLLQQAELEAPSIKVSIAKLDSTLLCLGTVVKRLTCKCRVSVKMMQTKCENAFTTLSRSLCND